MNFCPASQVNTFTVDSKEKFNRATVNFSFPSRTKPMYKCTNLTEISSINYVGALERNERDGKTEIQMSNNFL